MSRFLKSTLILSPMCFQNQNEKSNLNYRLRVGKKHKTNKNNNSKNSLDKPPNNKQSQTKKRGKHRGANAAELMIIRDAHGHNQFGVGKQKQTSKKNLKVKGKRKISK